MLDVLNTILPVFVVVGFGYLATSRGLFSESAVDGLMTFAQSFAIPALLFRAMSTLDLGSILTLPLFLTYYGGATASFLAALLGARFLLGRPWTDSIAIGFAGLFANGLLLGVPVTERAFGPDATAGNFGIIAVNSAYCYTIGITMMETVLARQSGGTMRNLPGRVLKAMFRNNMIIGILAGIAVNLTGLPIPEFFGDSLDLIARAALPAALFGLGGVLCNYRPEGDLRAIALIVVCSLLLHPATSWGIGLAVGLPTPAFRSAIVMAAMAPGVNTYIFANLYGVGKRVVASSILIGTALSLFTSWAWLALLH
ncbi:AEC family transporter [Tropicimonas sp.]|uniref:AEC family transporter n=1 Tax=Tropicimonas sp. TaxID=2067044 RepID=UPI003A837453